MAAAAFQGASLIARVVSVLRQQDVSMVENGAASKGGCSHDWLPHVSYFIFGGYLSKDFLTMSSSLPSIFAASLLCSRAIARHTRERVLGSRRSITSVPSV